MKEIETPYGLVREKPPTIVLTAYPRNTKEVKKLIKIDRANPRVMVLCYGGKCEK
jgi:hypothetical protein